MISCLIKSTKKQNKINNINTKINIEININKIQVNSKLLSLYFHSIVINILLNIIIFYEFFILVLSFLNLLHSLILFLFDLFLHLLLQSFVGDKLNMFFQLILNGPSVDFFCLKHSVLPMNGVSLFLRLLYFLDSLNSVHIKSSVVSDGLHLKLLHFQSGIISQFLSMDFSVSFSPLEFLGIVLGFEMRMTLGPAELENLTVVSHEGNSVAGVNRGTAEIALIYSHL